MHLLVPFAAPLSEAGRAAAATLQLPRLRQLLARCDEVARDEGDEWSLSPPHERALARALGWQGASGLLPWAARAARADGIEPDDLAWGQLTPCHWHMGTEQVSLLDPAALVLDEPTSRRFFDAVQGLFTSEGFVMHWGAPLRWYVAHESLAELPTASLDRVIGRNVDAWLPEGAGARLVRRLQNEAQMLLYTHPANDARQALGLLPLNSFWLSGCGPEQAAGPAPRVDERLRAPALAENWPAWVKAWETLDGGPVADLLAAVQRGQPVQLSLCGERAAVTFQTTTGGFISRLRSAWHKPALRPLLESL
jgi:hypothetical protein